MMTAGSQPTSASSTLTGLSLLIYNARLSGGLIPPETAVTKTIGSTTFTESETNRASRVLKAKLDAWCIASSTITTITTTGIVTVALGIAVSTTGTASAQTGATTSTGTGTIS